MTVTVALIGAGRMGAAIAAELALHCATVRAFDHSEFTRTRAMDATLSILRNQYDEKLISLAAMTAAAARITVSKELAEAVRDADLVVEAVPDELVLKQRLFADLHTMCEAKTVFSTNSINLHAADVGAPLRGRGTRLMCGIRFLHPVSGIDEVEVTADDNDAASAAVALLRTLHFVPYLCRRSELVWSQRRRLSKTEVEERHAAKRALCRAEACDDEQSSRTQALVPSGADCSVCWSAPVDSLLLPCGHKVLCAACAQAYLALDRKCIACRAPIEQILPLALPPLPSITSAAVAVTSATATDQHPAVSE